MKLRIYVVLLKTGRETLFNSKSGNIPTESGMWACLYQRKTKTLVSKLLFLFKTNFGVNLIKILYFLNLWDIYHNFSLD